MAEFQSSTTGAGLPEPDAAAQAHSRALHAHLARVIAGAGGWIGFDRYMAEALYAPGLGYYSAGARKFGAAGDFVTAPEVSPMFSRCLARQCAEVLGRLGGGEILEVGAGSGIMAADLLRELAASGTLPRHYLILEVSPDLRARQHDTLAREIPHLLDRVRWLDRLPETPLRGCVLANEVVDAMPVRRFRRDAGSVSELGVGVDGTGFAWRAQPADESLLDAVARLEDELGPLPVGYVSEINTYAGPWLAAVSDALAAGLVLLIDYGDARRGVYHPARRDGTLLCHYRHRAHGDPFWWPGLNDITAQVDFTALAETGVDAGLAFAGYTTQAWFLLASGLQDMALESEPERDGADHYRRMQQLKTLTLPTEMGERFKVLGMTRGMAAKGDREPRMALLGFALHDLRDQL